MRKHFKWIDITAIPRLHGLLSSFAFWEIGWVMQVPNLLLHFLDCVSDPDEAASWSRYVTQDVQKALLVVDADDSLIQHGRADATEAASHLLALPDLARVFALSN